MSYPLVRDLAAEGIPVRLTCGVLGHSTQAYYAWATNPVSDRDRDGASLTDGSSAAPAADAPAGAVDASDVPRDRGVRAP